MVSICMSATLPLGMVTMLRSAVRMRVERMPIDALELTASGSFDDLLAVDEAIEKLAAQEPRLAELVRLRFFSGLGVDETARVLGCAERTVVREWSYAKAWLLRYLQSGRE